MGGGGGIRGGGKEDGGGGGGKGGQGVTQTALILGKVENDGCNEWKEKTGLRVRSE